VQTNYFILEVQAMFRKFGVLSSEDRKISWWWLGIKVGVIVGLIVWWWLENQNKKNLKNADSEKVLNNNQSIPLPMDEPSSDEPLRSESPAPSADQPAEPDDLTKIEGIGPKINRTLQEAGIQTYHQLAASDPAFLKQILLDANIRIGFPDTWPEQAALAAKADWSGLTEFQSELQGGRRRGS
jgi:predicted flap endonuclease-1-like 5' DNA nuclease